MTEELGGSVGVPQYFGEALRDLVLPRPLCGPPTHRVAAARALIISTTHALLGFPCCMFIDCASHACV